jgi:serine-type D-Ala-D-Ala carboxypeptidase (penicillin-binding protein 5/6)
MLSTFVPSGYYSLARLRDFASGFGFLDRKHRMNKIAWCGAAVALLWIGLLATAASGQDKLEPRLRPIVEQHSGKVAVAVRYLESGDGFTWQADEPMPTASLIKVPIMIEAYRQAEQGKLDLDGAVTFRDEDKTPGSGILSTHFSPGLQLSVRDAIRLMIVWSDNAATNLVLDEIGLSKVSAAMVELGCPQTQLHAKVFRPDSSIAPERSRQFGLGSTTAAEMVSLLERLHRHELASPGSCEAMLDHLAHCEDRSKLARHLPSDVKLAHKTGSVSASRCDAGIMETPRGPVAVCVLTAENRDRRWADDNAGDLLCAAIGKAVYEFYATPEKPEAEAEESPSSPEELKLDASGRLVEDLQRTLNARLAPSPELAVDGEFGPATEAAVKAFQESKELEPDGVVRRDTWEALGLLVTSDRPVPDPETINAEELSKQPPDDLDGPPAVTCKAWAIGDARTGKLLWGGGEADARPMASTTKIMTAWLVMKLAKEDPSILDEEAVFSERADDTPGSTAAIRAGERLSIRELLYGLLLPSGNDASVALAEHFGSRFSAGEENDEESDEEQDALELFVAEMNREAERLGLGETRFANPHGLSANGHRASARDLLKLAWTAMQEPRFREYVQTRQRGCCVIGPGGYQRNVVWKNTNQLLGTEGYLGVKTGTTSAAGACLVSVGRRNDDELMVVILGAASTESRYTDTRNLYRWAWRQRAESSAATR